MRAPMARCFTKWKTKEQWLAIAGCVSLASCVSHAPTMPRFSEISFPPEVVPAYVVDTSYRYLDDTTLVAAESAHNGNRPAAWGRYIINRAGSGPTRTVLKELRIAELASLREASLPLVPIVIPDQKDLAGTESMGNALAIDSAKLIEAILGRTAEKPMVLVFLDVEPNQRVAADYLKGWCIGLRDYSSPRVKLLPGVYANGSIGGRDARQAINAIRQDCAIEGIWFANYVRSSVLPRIWRDMSKDNLNDLATIDGIPVYLWQYHEHTSAQMDFNLINPMLADAFMHLTIKLADQDKKDLLGEDPRPSTCHVEEETTEVC